MAPRWIHEFFDVLTFGRSYWRIHKKIDKWFEVYGVEHRKLEHEYYQMFKNHDLNEFLKSVPQLLHALKNIEEGVKLAHCVVDKVWDELSLEQKKGSIYIFQRLILEGQVRCEPLYWEDFQKLRDYIERKKMEELL